MREISIIDARESHIPALAAGLRTPYCASIRRAGESPETLIRRRFLSSICCRSGFVDGQIAAMWGVSPPANHSLITGVGEPWVFTTDAIRLASKTALRLGREEIRKFRAVFGRLEGIVSAEDACAPRYAERVGCVLGPAISEYFYSYEVT